MHRIKQAKALRDYKIEINFEDNKVFVFDATPYLYGEMFEPLKDKEEFKKMKVDKVLGTVVWANGADFCPDFLYKEMLKK